MRGYLLNNVSVDTIGDAIKSDGGQAQVYIQASNFGGGKVTLQARGGYTSAVWIDLTLADGTPAEFTANATRVINYIAQGSELRAVLSGSTSPVGVIAWVS